MELTSSLMYPSQTTPSIIGTHLVWIRPDVICIRVPQNYKILLEALLA